VTHPIERARERYGLELSSEDISFAKHAIRADSVYTLRLRLNRDGTSVVAVRIRYRWLAALAKSDGYVITFLPESVLGRHRKLLHKRKRWLRAYKFEIPTATLESCYRGR
jgi:hypothetical protein